jgi:hypothetical protein
LGEWLAGGLIVYIGGFLGLPFFWGLGGLWADQALVGLGEYPFFAALRLAVSPLRRLTFFTNA